MNETKTQLIQTGFTLDRLHQDSKIDNEAYTILKDRNRQAINYSQCCKIDSEQLFDFLEWFNNYCTVDIKPNKEDVELYLSK